MIKVELYVEWSESTQPGNGINQMVSNSLDAARSAHSIITYLSPFLDVYCSLKNAFENVAAVLTLIQSTSGDANILSVIQSIGSGAPIHSVLSSMGDEALVSMWIGMGLKSRQKLFIQIGIFSTILQNLKGLLSRGDNVNFNQSVIAGLIENLQKYQSFSVQISESISFLQDLKGLLSRGDNVNFNQSVIAGLIENLQKYQQVNIDLSDSISLLQNLKGLLSRGDNTITNQSVISGLIDGTITSFLVKMSMADPLAVLRKIATSISGDPASTSQSLLMEILATNDIHVFQKTLAALSDITSRYFSIPAQVYLDGRPLSGRVTSPITITCNEANIHNEIQFSSSDQDLFPLCDREFMKGEIRIEAQVGARMIQFIIADRKGESTDFTVTGISVSDLEDSFAEDISFVMTEPMLASEIAASLTNYCPVEWQVHDWVVPADFSFSGKPIDGIQQLAAEIGAIVRCSDDGALVVRNKWPTRPIDMPFALPAVSFDESTVIDLDPSEVETEGYNAVEVLGRQQEVQLPMLELEPSPDGKTPAPGETIRVRVYWAGLMPDVSETYVTAGRMRLLDNGAVTVRVEENVLIEFKDGKSSVQYPISDLVSYEWVGYPAAEISWAKNSMELFVPDNGFRVARVKYKTEFQRYEIDQHSVELLIAVFFMNVAESVDVSIRTEEEPIWADVISGPLLTTSAAAVARGVAFIDGSKYPKAVINTTVPYNDSAIDGNIAYLHDSRIGSPGNYQIAGSQIVIDGPMVTNELELKKCLMS